ncbi:hypothetical protein Scep_022244 [Stephania cephalantha]|uniref:Uncharacterized protein n=1 Tax=Stephania cephalantha TaxID=152367 RepID=A0AAP0F507_9MAGN
MEMEKSPTLPMEKLICHGLINIFTKALKVPIHIVTIFVSRLGLLLPLIFTTFLHKFILSLIFKEAAYRARQLPIDTSITNWIVAITFYFMKHGLKYMVFFHLIILLTAILTVLFSYGKEGVMKLPGYLRGPVARTRWRRPFIKLGCACVMSFLSYVVVVSWLVIGLLKASNFIFYSLLYVVSFIATLAKWQEFSAMWNFGVDASNLEGKQGFEALTLKTIFPVGIKLSGIIGVCLHFLWCFDTSYSSIYFRTNYGGLLCGGIVEALLFIGLVWKKLI